ncbi:DUF979 domain-containing protein [uncultured Sphingomonas sp.]|uniref:DUF979 domain-containing protein n=1 Tax=uncultured Sphingomonas sp. TaxID=158754 RepID=UPI0025CF1841|nr:DUF979 domain-containing protein [uncultured Sphingomonas sp.]
MIGVGAIYAVAGLVFLAFAWGSLRDRGHGKRWGTTAFYGLIALSFFAGDRLGDIGNGVLVLALVAIAGTGAMRRGSAESAPLENRRRGAALHGDRLFLLALVIPATALGGTLLFKQVPALVDPRQATLVALALGVLVALAIGCVWLRAHISTPFEQGRRLMDGVGWAAALPQMLAALGAVFALAGVGDVVGGLITHAIPEGSLFGAVIAYALGMAFFTMVMGNAFAAFPVMASAIGIPLLVRHYGGNPATIAAIGMLAGFCGTLLTPMAANFNLVPAALLELRDRNAVIRQQIGTAVPLLGINILLIYFLGFR